MPFHTKLTAQIAMILSVLASFSATQSYAAEQNQIPSQDQVVGKVKDAMLEEVKKNSGNISIKHESYTSSPLSSSKNTDSVHISGLNIEIYDERQSDKKFGTLVQQAYDASSVGQLEASLALYKQALNMDPNNPDILYAMGTIYHKCKDFTKAQECYKKVLETYPMHYKALSNYLALMAEVSPQGSLKELHELEVINDKFSPVLGQIGMVYANQKQYEEAIKYLQKAYQNSPLELIYLYNLAAVYDQSGNPEAAKSTYYQLLEQSKNLNLALPVSEKNIYDRIEVINLLQ